MQNLIKLKGEFYDLPIARNGSGAFWQIKIL